ncbi:MAG TPA: XrtA system polysaccharide deacetylase [Terriglobales bacterium]|nr:XrtA system polysaccharide deacetylase [Terriglobales bacterium]
MSETLAQVAVSIDLEEYFQVEAMAAVVAREQWPRMPARVEAATERLLELLEAHAAAATFFVVGWVAERHPTLIARIAAAGHELGCHSQWHRPVFRLGPAEFREDTRRAKAAIEGACGRAARGYRAPNFSIRSWGPQAMDWAMEILAELGFSYDSSLHPVRHPLYGAAGAPRRPFQHSRSGLLEIPMASVERLGQRLPIAGGAYWRLAPLVYTRWGLSHAIGEGLRPVCYLHPWEIDPEQPRVRLAFGPRLRHYTGLKGMEAKLEALLRRFGSRTIRDLYAPELEAVLVPA